jgi:hypothetical protein
VLKGNRLNAVQPNISRLNLNQQKVNRQRNRGRKRRRLHRPHYDLRMRAAGGVAAVVADAVVAVASRQSLKLLLPPP